MVEKRGRVRLIFTELGLGNPWIAEREAELDGARPSWLCKRAVSQQ
jgi:hypothetical protein